MDRHKTNRNREGTKRTTLHTVAKHAGVSYQTVSNVINNPHLVSESTLQRVQNSIQALGYVPNFSGNVFRQNKSMTLGCAFYEVSQPTPENPYHRLVQAILNESVREFNYSMMTYTLLENNIQQLTELKTHLQQGRLDGLIIVGTHMTQEFIEEVTGWQKPIVLYDHSNPSGQLPSVVPQYQDGIRQAIKHLYQQGRRTIAFMAGDQHDHAESGALRLQGYLQITNELGIYPGESHILSGNWSYQSGLELFDKFWSLKPRPDAIVAASDRMAVGLISAALRAGVKVPQEIAITGFDDIEFSRYCYPSLTTVRVPHQAMSMYAISALMEMMGSGVSRGTWIAPVELQIRESTQATPNVLQ